MNASKAEVSFQTLSVDITDGSFTERFEQYDVNIYKM